MDLVAMFDAVRRYKYVAIVGSVAAILLALFAFAKPDPSRFPPLERRNGPDYQSTVRLFITQPGFPWGRSALRYSSEGGGPPVVEGDPDRFATLAVLYANLANSGTILRKVRLDGKQLIDLKGAKVTTDVVPASASSSTPLPLIDIVATYKTAQGAEELARQTTNSLVQFVTDGQKASSIPKSQRVLLQMIDGPQNPLPVGGGSKTLPVLVFMTVMALTISTILVLRNLAGAQTRLTAPTAVPVDEQPAPQPVAAAKPIIAKAPPSPATDVVAGRSARRPRPPVADRLGHVAWPEERAAGEER